VQLRDWLAPAADPAGDYDRLYVPGNDSRWLRRNAIVAFGNTAVAEDLDALEPRERGDDAMLREHAVWARTRIDERGR
jgi:hypothetical protein